MATTSPSHRQRKAPAEADVPNAVPSHGSDKGSGLSPWPVADTPGRPFLSPHRLAGLTGDKGMADALRPSEPVHGERLANRIRSWVIIISLTLMGVAVLFTAFDAYLDRAL